MLRVELMMFALEIGRLVIDPSLARCCGWRFVIREGRIYSDGRIGMIEDRDVSSKGEPDVDKPATKGVDIGRRAALKNIGALAGAAPAVAVLLTPSASRALGGGGSPCEGACGPGHGPAPGAPSNTGAPGGQETGLLGKRES